MRMGTWSCVDLGLASATRRSLDIHLAVPAEDQYLDLHDLQGTFGFKLFGSLLLVKGTHRDGG
jgi:hypothetical protein